MNSLSTRDEYNRRSRTGRGILCIFAIVLAALLLCCCCSAVAAVEKNYVTNTTVYASGTAYEGLNIATPSASIGTVDTAGVETAPGVAQTAYADSARVTGTDLKTYTVQDLRGSVLTVTDGKVASGLSVRFADSTTYTVPADKFAFSDGNLTFTLTNAESSSYDPKLITTECSVVTSVNGLNLPIGDAKSVTVTFNAMGGAVSPASKTCYVGYIYGSLPTPSLSGYIFNGWFNGTNQEITESTIVTDTEDHTLYANWTERTYSNGTLYHILGTGQSLSSGSYGYWVVTESVPSSIQGKVLTLKLPDDERKGPNFCSGGTINFESAYIGDLREYATSPYQGSSYETPSSGTGYAFYNLTGNTVLVTQHGVSGYRYVSLKNGTTPYKNMINAVRKTAELAESMDMKYVVLGMTVLHGVGDMSTQNTTESKYMEYLSEWQRDVDADVKKITHQTEDVKLYTTQVAAVKYLEVAVSAHPTDVTVIANSQLRAGLDNPNIVCTNPQYQFVFWTDNLHMCPPSYRLDGEYLGNIIAQDFLGRDLKTVYPMKISLNDERNAIEVVFHTGEGVTLQRETTNVKSIANDGFLLKKHTVSSDPLSDYFDRWIDYSTVSISSVSISGNKVVLYLNTTIPETDLDTLYVTYASAASLVPDHAVLSGKEKGVRGNIADTSNLKESLYPWDGKGNNDPSNPYYYYDYDSYMSTYYPADIPNYASTFYFKITEYDRTVPNAITITFNANGGALSGAATKTVTYGGTYGALPSVARDGFTFLGWYASPWMDAISPEITEDTYVTRADNHSLYARWVKGSYTFGSGTVNTSSGESTYGDTWYESTPAGYTKKVATLPSPKITVSAGSHGSISPATASVIYGSSPSYSITADPGYVIKDIKVNGQSVGNASSYTFSPVTVSQTISAEFATDTSVTYNVTVVSGVIGGTGSANRTSGIHTGDIVEYTAVADAGYHFISWNSTDSVNFTNSTANPYQLAMGAADLVVSSVFAGNVTNVTYYNQSAEYASCDNTFNESLQKPSDPTWYGYTFTGWNVTGTDTPLESEPYVKNGKWNHTGEDQGTLSAYATWKLVEGLIADEYGNVDFAGNDHRWLPKYTGSSLPVEVGTVTGLVPYSVVYWPEANGTEAPTVDDGYTEFSVISVFNLNATKADAGNAQITFHLTDLGIYSLDNIYVKYWTGSSWTNLDIVSRDAANNRITAATSGFTAFALVGQCYAGTDALQFNLTSGSGFVEDGGRYYLDADTTANIGVWLKYNLTKMGKTDSDSVRANTFNYTAVSNFTVTDQMAGVTYVPDTSRAWYPASSLSMSGNMLRLAGITTTSAIPFNTVDGEVFLGNLSVTAPSSWSNWSDADVPLNISINDALKAAGEGAYIVYAGASIEAEDITTLMSVSAPDTAFSFYPLSHAITNSTENGKVTANKTKAPAGAIVHVDAMPDTGYHFASWNVTKSTSGQISVDGSGNFVMPADDVNAGAEFAGNVTTVTFYNVSTVLESKLNTYKEATNSTPATPSRVGYTFNGWNVSNESGTPFDSIGYNDSGIWNYTGNNGDTLYVYANWSVASAYNIAYIQPANGAVSGDAHALPGSTVTVTATPASGYEFVNLIVTENGSSTAVTSTGTTFVMPAFNVNVTAQFTAVPTPTPVPSSGGGSNKGATQIMPSQTASGQNVVVDVSAQYSGQNFVCIGASEADIAAIRAEDPILAAELEAKIARAEAAGIKLTNNNGAPAIVISELENPALDHVTFSKVYDISSTDPNVKLTQVTVTVPKSDIAAAGLTANDVTIYHNLATYDLWVPLDTLQVTEDAANYYYTAATDGASPFGVLIKRFDDTPAVPTTNPTTKPTQQSPAPILGIIAGLAVAATVLCRLSRR